MFTKTFKDIKVCPKGCEGCSEMKAEMKKGKPYRWYRMNIPVKQWTERFSKTPGYTLLGIDKVEATVGFLSVVPPFGCLEIEDYNQLLSIQKHREGLGLLPLPMPKV